MALTNSRVRQKLEENGYFQKDLVLFNKGAWIVWEEYFSTQGNPKKDLINNLKKLFGRNIEILKVEDHWDNSRFWVKFRIKGKR